MARRHGTPHQTPRQLDGWRTEDRAQLRGPERGIRGDVEGALHVREHRAAIGVRNVARVHALDHQSSWQREPAQDRGAHQGGGQERPGEQAAAAIRARRPEDQRGSQAHHARTAGARLEGVQVAFHLRLVLRVEGRGDAIARPALVHRLLRAGRVHADRGRDDQPLGSDRSRGLHDAAATEDVRPPQVVHVVRGLDAPGQVHDGSAPLESRLELVDVMSALTHVTLGRATSGTRRAMPTMAVTAGSAARASTTAVPTFPVAPTTATRIPGRYVRWLADGNARRSAGRRAARRSAVERRTVAFPDPAPGARRTMASKTEVGLPPQHQEPAARTRVRDGAATVGDRYGARERPVSPGARRSSPVATPASAARSPWRSRARAPTSRSSTSRRTTTRARRGGWSRPRGGARCASPATSATRAFCRAGGRGRRRGLRRASTCWSATRPSSTCRRSSRTSRRSSSSAPSRRTSSTSSTSPAPRFPISASGRAPSSTPRASPPTRAAPASSTTRRRRARSSRSRGR